MAEESNLQNSQVILFTVFMFQQQKNNEAFKKKKKKKYAPHIGNLTKIVSVGSIDIGFTRNGL